MNYLRLPRVALLALVAFGALSVGDRSSAVTPSPAPLNSNAATDSEDDGFSHIVTDGAGNWVVVWRSTDSLGNTIGTDGDILVSRSTDNGATWTAPVPLNTNAAADSGGDWPNSGTTDGLGNWIEVWHSDDDLGGTIGADSDILIARSTDNGVTWTAPVPLNTTAAADSGGDAAPRVVTDGAGNWVAVWYSSDTLGGTIGMDYDILIARSTDNGVTWTAPVPLNTNAATDGGADLVPWLISDGAGTWVAVWHSSNSLGGTIGSDFDILVSRSTDDGVTWTAPVPLNTNAGADANDDNGGGLATDGEGQLVAAWWSWRNFGGRDTAIFMSRSSDSGVTWSDPVLLSSGSNADPRVSTDLSGNWVVVWWSENNLGGTIGTDRDVLMSISTDNGATWTAPAPVNTNAATDTGHDFGIDIANDAGGNWITVWMSGDSLNGTIGTDYDILYTNCSPLDSDCDGVPDAGDNCQFMANPGQQNSVHPLTPAGDACDNPDGDGFADAVDGCPDVSTSWVVPPDDNPDCDGFPSTTQQGMRGPETFIGTDPDLACGANAWPVDINNDNTAGLTDILLYIPVFGATNPPPPAGYNPRFDLTADRRIALGDILMFIPFFNITCTP